MKTFNSDFLHIKNLLSIGFTITLLSSQILTRQEIASAITIINDRDVWKNTISMPLVIENFNDDSLPPGVLPDLYNLTEKTTFSTGLSIVPESPLDINLINIPDTEFGAIRVEFNQDGNFKSSIKLEYEFPTKVLGFGFDIDNPGTFFEEVDVDVTINLQNNRSATQSFGFFPEFRQEFIGVVVDEPISFAQVQYDVELFQGQLGHTVLITNEVIFPSVTEPNFIMSYLSISIIGMISLIKNRLI